MSCAVLNGTEYAMGKVLLIIKWLFYLLAALVAIDLWCIAISIVFTLVGMNQKCFLLVKIFSAILPALIIWSYVALYIIMYQRTEYVDIISVVWSKRIRLIIWLTFGYYNTYLLSLYFVRFRYSQYELLQYRVNVIHSVLSMIPILNLIVYWRAIHESEVRLSFMQAATLYFKGELMSYLIKENYSHLLHKIESQ